MTRASQILQLLEKFSYNLYAVSSSDGTKILIKEVGSLEAGSRLLAKMVSKAENAANDIESGELSGKSDKELIDLGILPDHLDGQAEENGGDGRKWSWDGMKWTSIGGQQ
jgi:hypothetical protein